jgi:NADPH:quinone reductase-like Zn-dependent oxidoreductase
VYGISGGGGQAEYVLAHERMLVPIPDRLDCVHAACVPEVFITAHDALFTQAGLRLGERVLVHAVGSGVGTAAVQLARAAGARVLGTSRTPDKLARAQELGLDAGLSAEDFAADALRETGGAGVEVVLDVVGGPYLEGNVAALGTRGRLVLLSTLGGQDAPLPIRTVMSKRLRIFGSVLRARPLEEKIAASQAFAAQVNPLLASGKVRPVLDRLFSLEQVADAHAYIESNQGFGKIVLTLR